MDLYGAIVQITIVLLAVNVIDACTNRLMERGKVICCTALCAAIGTAAVCEWVGVNADVSLTLRYVAKVGEFGIAPFIGVLGAHCYGKMKVPATAGAIVVLHALFQLVAADTGMMFYIDDKGIYHRGRWYWIYIVVFGLSILYCLWCIIQGEMQYQTQLEATVVLSVLFVAFGIAMQMRYSNLRVDYLCIAIANILLYNHRCRLSAKMDGLTMLLNRTRYEKDLYHIKMPAIIINMDVDGFKQINDTCGHAAGDRYLRQTAADIRQVYGKYGWCYRQGGDEFCVILNKNLENVDKLNAAFQAAVSKHREQDPMAPEVSVGYARYDEKSGSLRQVIIEADTMMYRNKKQKESI